MIKKAIFLFSIIILFGCKTHKIFYVKEYKKTKIDSLWLNQNLEEDKEFSNTVCLHIVNVNPNDTFTLMDNNNRKTIDGKLTNGEHNGLFPSAYFGKIYKDNEYVLQINGDKHFIKSKKIKKYMFITIEYDYKIKKYLIIYTNRPKAFK